MTTEGLKLYYFHFYVSSSSRTHHGGGHVHESGDRDDHARVHENDGLYVLYVRESGRLHVHVHARVRGLNVNVNAHIPPPDVQVLQQST